jgi:hypothetical protein
MFPSGDFLNRSTSERRCGALKPAALSLTNLRPSASEANRRHPKSRGSSALIGPFHQRLSARLLVIIEFNPLAEPANCDRKLVLSIRCLVRSDSGGQEYLRDLSRCRCPVCRTSDHRRQSRPRLPNPWFSPIADVLVCCSESPVGGNNRPPHCNKVGKTTLRLFSSAALRAASACAGKGVDLSGTCQRGVAEVPLFCCNVGAVGSYTIVGS